MDIWSYPQTSWGSIDLTGFGVEATDGSIGTVDEATHEAGASFLVCDTGPWIFGRKVLLPAGVIERIDLDNRKVEVRLTKDQIKNSPEYDADTEDYRSDAYRDRVGTYYDTYR
ncbi:MAG TPA: PRC-barrel domain containing protein [Actinomycetota bacterium]|nr:PRC-barrel domain containing protein [Actinomycetota bacterium]